MKQDIHPDYHEINVVMTDGSTYKTRSTWGKEGDTMTLDVDSKTHPAWVGGVHIKKTGQVEKFNSRFAGMNFGSKKADASESEEKKDA
jgi:large subunit ribosomal protein L31